MLEAVHALYWIIFNNKSLSNSSWAAHIRKEIVSFLLKGAEEVAHSLLSAGCVAQQRCMAGAGIHGFAISTLLKNFGYT